ncbi:MAG TPA: HAD hydrolase-like protein, partial [Rhodanobacteraceae bacterium]|nr:HAD hydrolase-like protein [Rhodanobacteraceae bacterium]
MSPISPPRAVFFDLDGTLVDSAPDLIAAVEALCNELGAPPPDAERVREVVSAGGRAMLRRGLPGADDVMIDQWLPRFLDLYSVNMVQHTRLYAGMDAVLADFETRGIHWGVVTNKPGWLARPLLQQMNLDSRCAALVT